MDRRALLAAPLALPIAPILGARRASAQAQQPRIATEEFMVPSADAGIELFVRNKRPEATQSFAPGRTLLFVHGAAYPAHTTFDLPLVGISWMDYLAGSGYDVWCMDIRGFGRSTRPPEMNQPAEANAPLVRGVTALQDIGAVNAFIRQQRRIPRLSMMGHSWGANLVARYAADYGGTVERVVLYGPGWLSPRPAGPPPRLGAFSLITQAQARDAWTAGVPDDKRAALLPAGWFEHFAGVTWATDPEGLRLNPPVLRAPNGSLQDAVEFWQAGRPFYDPAQITVPALLVVGEWDRVTPPAMAVTLFPLLTASPGKRLIVLAEGTHNMLLERNRGALYTAVQIFLNEAPAG